MGGETQGQSPRALMSTSLIARASTLIRVCPTYSSWTPRETQWTYFIVRDAPRVQVGDGKYSCLGRVMGVALGGSVRLSEVRQNLAALKTLARPW